ncbi:Gti1/Pac2 family-domain-containing protein [Dichomitus squalens]|uniref:Gti1/Pac2 family-domain-containing protein n=1 Tax=Dichomitus squalens TaxID=114155 RepID=A0A4Q9N8Z4_9APHY|nr:Gti1/Pac2 family-domain-containing protein [Dichomitus squalens]TBU46473.1 Gti1/Pac2 family-domain-containing protein [Dichomitus squalens]TBU65329.1 Gti1/Pac2 family-domain-containing protein [Dichomitus squalens]
MFYAPAQDVQRPTHPRLHVRDARDAHIVFEAVRQGRLKPVMRRLNELERSTYIASGSLFVWEESDDEMGLKRWTDGRVWSQSRMREPYLFYDEKLGDEPPSEPKTKCTYRFVEGPSRTWTSSAQSHYERSDHHPMGLVKQAYSAWVLTSVNAKPRKWHLTAYFTYADLPNIPTVDKDPLLSTITVPSGVYKSGKARSRNSDASTPALPSPPSTPGPAGPSSRPSSPLQSSSRAKKDGVVLPSLHSAIVSTPLNFSGSHHRTNPRMAEDQRMIQMLNSRPIL